MVFVAQVDVAGVDADDGRGDQHPFEKSMRVALEIGAILERAGLAFVDVDRHEARRGLVAHDAPLAPGRKARAAQSPQPRVFQRLDQVVALADAGNDFGREHVTAVRAVGFIVRIGRSDVGMRGSVIARSASAAGSNDSSRLAMRVDVRAVREPRRRRDRVWHAAPDTGKRPPRAPARSVPTQGAAIDAHVVAQQRRQTLQQVRRTGHFAGQAVAHAHRERGATSRRPAARRSGDRRWPPRKSPPSARWSPCASATR